MLPYSSFLSSLVAISGALITQIIALCLINVSCSHCQQARKIQGQTLVPSVAIYETALCVVCVVVVVVVVVIIIIIIIIILCCQVVCCQVSNQ